MVPASHLRCHVLDRIRQARLARSRSIEIVVDSLASKLSALWYGRGGGGAFAFASDGS